MNCPQAERFFEWVEGDLSADDALALQQHLDGCEECRQLHLSLQEVDAGLKAELDREARMILSEGLEERVLQRCRGERKVRWLRPLLLRAAAAIGMVSLAGLAWWMAGEREAEPGETASSREVPNVTSTPAPTVASVSRPATAVTESTGVAFEPVDVDPAVMDEIRERLASAVFACGSETDDQLLPAFEARVAELRREDWPIENMVCRLTRHPDPMVADTAVRILGRTARPADVFTVARCLSDPRLSDSAVRALGRFRGDAAVTALSSWLRSCEDARPVLASLARIGSGSSQAALVRHGRSLLSRPGPAAEPEMATLLEALSEIGPEAMASLEALWGQGADETLVREAVLGHREEGSAVILGALRGDSPGLTRRSAVRLAGLVELEESVPGLRRAAEEEELRVAVIDALGRIGGADALLLLAGWNADANEPERTLVRARLVTCLQRLQPETFAAIGERLTSFELEHLIDALVEDGSERSGDSLLALVAVAGTSGHQARLLLALGELDRSEFVSQCAAYLDSPAAPRVRAAALISTYRLASAPSSVDLSGAGTRRSRLKLLLNKAVRRWKQAGSSPDMATLDRIAQVLTSTQS